MTSHAHDEPSGPSHGRSAGPRSRLTDHERALVRAEVRRLVTALSPFGILRRDALARAAGVTRWHEAHFERALQAAVESGEIEPLPLDFYGIVRHGAHRSGANEER